MATKLALKTTIGTYPHTQGLKDGSVESERVQLDHLTVSPISHAFRPMANDLAYDVSEMALATYIVARDHNRPVLALPMALVRQSAHRSLVALNSGRVQGPSDLNGTTLGARAYTQSTGVWLRGILQDQFGVDLGTVNWVTTEAAHVDGYQDPPNVRREEPERPLLDMLLANQLDAVAGVALNAHPDLQLVLPESAESEWLAKTGFRPVNHVLTVRQELVDANPWLPGELFGLFQRAAGESQTGASGPAAAAVFGLDANRTAFETMARYVFEQGIVSRLYSVDELFPAFA